MNRHHALGLAGLLAVAVAATAASDTAGQDGRTPVLLELFTSEGCSSCPPADRLLQTLDQQQPFAKADLIVLSEHVDYWDGQGWKDPYSSKLFTQRQQRYADHFGTDDIYTPELVIDGQHVSVGSNAAAAKEGVEQAVEHDKVKLALSNVSRDGNQIRLHAESGALTGIAGPATLYLVLAANSAQSQVRRGENAGRSLTHVAVVQTMVPSAKVANGNNLSKDLAVTIPSTLNAASGNLRVVAFLQSDRSQKIIAVAQSRL